MEEDRRAISKEKVGNAINWLALLHGHFINHGDYEGSARALGIRDDLLTLWRERPDPPPPLPWPSVRVWRWRSS